MISTFEDASVHSVNHYLDQIAAILRLLSKERDADKLLGIHIAPDMFDTGFHFAVAIQFAARALCLPIDAKVPELPEKNTRESLQEYHQEIAALIEPISASDLKRTVSHRAGDAELEQPVQDYLVLFALPNMIFHMSMAYAGLRHGGMHLGKANFDGLHVY